MLKIVDSSLFLVELIFSEIIIIDRINLKFELFPNFQKKNATSQLVKMSSKSV